jgi:hypothetical protein
MSASFCLLVYAPSAVLRAVGQGYAFEGFRFDQLLISHFGPGQVGVAQVGHAQAGPAQVGPSQIGEAQVSVAQISRKLRVSLHCLSRLSRRAGARARAASFCRGLR